MMTLVPERARSQMPTRIRAKRRSRDSLEVRLALADRIASLPGIETLEARPSAVPHRVDVWLRPPSASIRRQPEAVRLCSISRDGVIVHGLSDRDRHRIISRGWGRLRRNGVAVFLPRDKEELEVCWNILERAYHSLRDASAVAPQPKRALLGGLPRFSRTTLQ